MGKNSEYFNSKMFPITVTKFYPVRSRTASWKKFLEDAGIRTIYRERITKAGTKLYGLARQLTPKEKKEIEEGKYFIFDNFIYKAMVYNKDKQIEEREKNES
jgi:hypothetical protein